MIHLVASRSRNLLKVFARDGSLWESFAVGTDAWGNHGSAGALPPWGYDCWMPIGHYVLQRPQHFDPPIASEGYGQIPIVDLDAATLEQIVKAGKGTVNGLTANIGGIEAPLLQLSKYDRSALMIHGGGSNDPQPLIDFQPLLRAYGCSRMHNADWRELAAWLEPLYDGNTVVYSALETPATLSG